MSDGKGRYLGSVAVKPADFKLGDEEFGSVRYISFDGQI